MQQGSISIRNGKWCLQLMVDGGAVEWRATRATLGPAEGADALSRREAAALVRQLLAQIQVGPEVTRRATVAEAVDGFLRDRSAELKRSGLEHYSYLFRSFILPRWATVPLDNITTAEIQRWLQQLAAQGYAYQTVHHVRTAMSVMYHWSMRYDLVDRNPVLPTRATGRRTAIQRPLTPEEARALLRELPALCRDLVEFLLLTGLRVGEAAGLQAGDVNLSRETRIVDGHIVPPDCLVVRRAWTRWGTYTTPKTARSVRVIPLTPRALDIISARVARADGPESPVWTGPRGGVLNVHHLGRRVLKPAARRAGMEWVHWHTFRHTAATLAEMDAIERQRVLGHTQVSTTVRYSAPVAERVRRGLAVIEHAISAKGAAEGFVPEA